METAGQRSLSSGALLALCVLVLEAATNEEHFQLIGSSISVTPDLSSVPPPIIGLLWKHGSNKAVEWEDGDVVDVYAQFQGRSTLNTTTGELSITALTLMDSGNYSVEVTHSTGITTLSQLWLTVIAAVPKPTVTTSCHDDKTSCTLSCDGDSTDAGKVTYSWQQDDTVLLNTAKDLQMKDGLTAFLWYSCSMENPLSRETSDQVCNPLASGLQCSGARVYLGLVVFISLVTVVVVIVLIHRWYTGLWFHETGVMPWEPGFWQKQEVTDNETENNSSDGNEVKFKFIRRKDNFEAEPYGTQD